MDQENSNPAERTVVRRAVAADVPQMVLIGRRFLEETKHTEHGMQVNPHLLHEHLLASLKNDDYGVFVAVRGDRVIGVASAVRFAPYFTNKPMGLEMFWWAEPGHRGGVAAIRLFNEMEAWAKAAGCITFSMIDVPAINSSPAAAIYERRGYVLAERTWIKRIE